MVRGADRRHDLLKTGSQLSVLVEDVLPALLIQKDGASIGVNRLGESAQALAALRATARRGMRSSPTRSADSSWIAGTRRGYSDMRGPRAGSGPPPPIASTHGEPDRVRLRPLGTQAEIDDPVGLFRHPVVDDQGRNVRERLLRSEHPDTLMFRRLCSRTSASSRGDGLLSSDRTSQTRGLAGRRCVGAFAPRASAAVECRRADRLVHIGCRRQPYSCAFGGLHTGPSPVDRARAGSKHHLITDSGGIPLAITLTGGNRNDVTRLLPLIDGVGPVTGKPGASPQACRASAP